MAGRMGQAKQLFNMVRSAQNPTAMVNQMLQQNPNYGEIANVLQKHNGDAKAAFYDLAQQKGVNPNDVLNALR